MKKIYLRQIWIYGVLLVFALAYGVWYALVGAKQVSIHYEMGSYLFQIFAMCPLLWFAAGALAITILQWASRMTLPRRARRICLVLAVTLLVLYAALGLLPVAIQVTPPWPVVPITMMLVEQPALFLIPGVLFALGFGSCPA